MEIVGRVVNNGVVKQLKDDRKVVHFTVAINDYFKPKGSEQGTQTTLYVNCSYWLNTSIAERLIKGSVVELQGRLYLNAYKDMQGEPKASLNAHINNIKIHHASKAVEQKLPLQEAEKIADDLPF